VEFELGEPQRRIPLHLHGCSYRNLIQLLPSLSLSVITVWRTLLGMKIIPIFAILALLASKGLAQQPLGSLLIIEIRNQVVYTSDTADPTQVATKPGPTRGVLSPSFRRDIVIGDIVSVNGQRTKGTNTELITWLDMRPNPAPGQAIADATRSGFYEWNFEILKEDSTPIGSIRVSGMGGGVPPPGAVPEIRTANHVVVGG